MKLKITLFIFALISFFVDAATLYLYKYHATNMLLCVYLYTLTYAACWQLLTPIGLLLCIQDLLLFGYAGIQLIYLVPLTITNITVSYILYPNMLQLLCLITIASIMQTTIIESFLLGHQISTLYTVQTIYGNMIGVFLISLILRLSGLLGNRMRT